MSGPLEGRPNDPVTVELARWLTESPRFRAFAEAHAPKIRKKLRTAGDAEALRDVRTELLVARLFLGDRRIGLEFEPYGAKGGPDFTVTLPGERPFNLEVTRVRRSSDEPDLGPAILGKLRQLPPSVPNALLISLARPIAREADVDLAVRAIRARADRKDEVFFTGRGFSGSRAFYERFLRLGAVIVWSEVGAADERAAAWVNRSARIAVPARALRACVACLRVP